MSVNGAQRRVLHACVKKIHITMLYSNYCYIFIENFPHKFSPCGKLVMHVCCQYGIVLLPMTSKT